MSKFLITLPGRRPLAVMAPSALSAIVMARRHFEIPTNVSVVGAKVTRCGDADL